MDPSIGAVGGGLDTLSNLNPEFQKAYQISAKAEARPVELLQNRKTNVEAKVELLNEIVGRVEACKQLLPPLGTPFAIRDLLVATDDPRVLTGTAEKGIADPGKYNIEISQLAKHATALSNRFEDKDNTTVGTGYIRFKTDSGESKDVFIDEDNATLEGVAQAINSARVGMRASVINDQEDEDSPYRLLLTASGVGESNNVEYPEFYFVDGDEDFFIDEERPALNAILKYEGFQIESPTNEVKDLINGVNLNLKGLTDTGKPITISVEQDIPKTTVKVKDLVENLNQIFSFVQEQNKLDKDTPTQKTLGGDYGIRIAEDRVRTALMDAGFAMDGRSARVLSDVGIQFNKNGTLNFDEKKFENALNKDFDQVADLLAGDGATYGLIPKLNRALNSISSTGAGILSNQKDNYTNQVRDLQKNIDDKQAATAKKLEALKGKLARAQSAMAKLQGQSTSFGGEGA